MRRSITTFATLVTTVTTVAAAVALIPVNPATAATGMLYAGAVFRSPEVSATIHLERYADPAPSCYVVPPIPYQQSGWKYTWQNDTDSKIVIYPSGDCTDPALTTVAAHGGYAETSRNAKSFEVLD